MLLGGAAPAFAGRPLVADTPTNPNPTPFAGCSLGSACSPTLTLDGTPGIDAFNDGFGASNVYVYGEGVVSFGAPLPLTASLAGGTASFGDGTWFAPGLGAPLEITSYQSILGNHWFNWDDAGGHIMFQMEIRDDGACHSCVFGNPFWNPRDANLADFDVTFNGPGRGIEAYNVAPEAQPGFPPCAPDSGGPGNLACPGHFNNDLRGSSGTPEPASWALMIAGFGAVGSLLRHRRRLVA